MVTSQEIIEKSFYMALLEYTLKLGLTLDPRLYDKTIPSAERYEMDRKQIIQEKGKFITIFGAGNNQSKGMKDLFPTIVIEPKGFVPGGVGLNKYHLDKVGSTYKVSETPFESIDQYIDVHLVSKYIDDQRLLNQIMNTVLPQRGYLKPYLYDKAPFSGNIFIISSNFYDATNDERGIIEKVYTWEVQDTLLAPPQEIGSETPINTIEVDIQKDKGSSFGDLHIVK